MKSAALAEVSDDYISPSAAASAFSNPITSISDTAWAYAILLQANQQGWVADGSKRLETAATQCNSVSFRVPQRAQDIAPRLVWD
jgi:hypothetical protein